MLDMRSEDVVRTGLVTGEAAPDLTTDGQRLQEALRERGHTVDPVRWDEQSVNWARYDCLIVRSCWEYYTNREAFRDWIDTVDECEVIVINAPDLLRWNMHKYYLVDLEHEGVSVIPTEYVDEGSDVGLGAILERAGWTDAVVKPTVGTSSHAVWRVTTPVEPAAATRFRDLVSESDVLVQQFVPEVAQGELSFVFFGGEFSHAYRSFPATDDFRAHPNFGGSVEPEDPPEPLVDQAREVVSAASNVLSLDAAAFVYARVDGVERAGEFELMELELIEPYLGLSMSEGSVERFGEAVVTALRRRTTGRRVEGR
jgi:glutathione synthase/RimK-type ligase-like ATP-grasp enzyme